ncbi:Acetoin dehydrogenase operon transcriptional activator AcoR [Sporomusa ovata DSM 2662]|uniref:Response regulator of zinc sigma-54-dependent two-component system n=1 Tax=Sporomusa ovata TaxID=2378 RepID=A0A0U1L1Y3_9FIRM|nr:sigma 54-interacting transcriptional regulator [Sporomusa ovata]EQB25131.1 signal-transduction and transcriptional-control protein [Sporomusa ovata DSM 2662]CQR73686.1 Response regulator of zinc sigma-54-dependent two-component system [Sporomusa ovata]
MTIAALPMLDPVYVEWKKFLQTGNPYMCKARQQIIESWYRCYHGGVDPYDDQIHHQLDALDLHNVLKEKEKLIQIAKPFMALLYEFFKGSGFIIVLTDENGCILEMLCDEDNRQNPMSRCFYPGVSWREEDVGTNAIGTVIKLGESLQVSGAEHYCKKIHSFACSAASIYDSNGRIIGVLDISYASHASHLHTLGMVTVIAEAITAQLSIWQKNCELVLLNKRVTNFLNNISDGVLLVDNNEVVIEINPAGKAMLGKSEQHILGIELKRLFDSRSGERLTASKSYHDVEITVDIQGGGCPCVAFREPIINEQNVVTGGIIFLRSLKQVKNTVNRFIGNSAPLQFNDVVGKSVQICEAIHVASRAATTTSNILLTGESGTGKEIFAQAIHNRSAQHNGPFVAVNCGAIPRELIASELFGYEEGAFTGAKRGGKPGKFELASGGTLFLDEIGDMPLEQQIALLRVIQERKVTRIGSDKMIPINIRLICATNKNLLEEVEKGAFRLDLYYRVNVLSIIIPPLRERREDIQPLFEHFLEKLSREQGRKYSVEFEVIAYLNRYHWPGNVRELQNVIEHAACLAGNGVIAVGHLPEVFYAPSSPRKQAVPQPYDTIFSREQRKKIAGFTEKDKIISKLDAFAGNVSRVAKELGISRKTLYNKMRLYAITNYQKR